MIPLSWFVPPPNHKNHHKCFVKYRTYLQRSFHELLGFPGAKNQAFQGFFHQVSCGEIAAGGTIGIGQFGTLHFTAVTRFASAKG